MKPYLRSRRPALGRTPRRDGASVQGHLSTWVESIVSQTMAETAKLKSSNRALDLYVNDAMGHGLLESLIVETVGIGLTPQFAPDHEALGLDAAWADEFGAQLGRIWNNWGLDCRKWCDAQRRLDIYGLQQLAYFSWRLDGIGLFQIRSKSGRRPSPLAVLPIDPARMVTPSDASDLPIYDGVEVDDDGMPVKVWLAKPSAIKRIGTSYVKADCTSYDVWDEATGLPKILMVTGVRNIAEYRQDSIMGPMIEELRNNRDFVGAALVRAMLSNLFVAFVENSGATAKDDWSERVVELEKGTILQGSKQEVPHFFKQEAQPQGYREMFDSIVDRLGMCTSRGSENVSRKYQASYSASKASMVKAQQVNSVEHMTLNSNFNQPILMWLVYERAMAGALSVPSTQTLFEDLNELSRADWMPQPMPEIDRAKKANAIQTELETHQTTYAEVYAEKSADWRKKLRQRAKEKAYIKQLESEFEISMDPGAAAPLQAPANQPDDEGSDQEAQ